MGTGKEEEEEVCKFSDEVICFVFDEALWLFDRLRFFLAVSEGSMKCYLFSRL